MATTRLQNFPTATPPTTGDYVYFSQSGVEQKMQMSTFMTYLAGVFLSTLNNLSELTATAATARSNISAAKSGTNADITAITALTTALSVLQGGTGVTTKTGTGATVGAANPTVDSLVVNTFLNAVGALQLNGNAGTAGFVATSAGAGVPAVWAAPVTASIPDFLLQAQGIK